MVGLIHTSGSATEDLHPRLYNYSTNNNINAVLDDFNPYNALTTSIVLPASGPNSGTAVVHIFSQQGAVIYSFCISHPSVDNPLSAAIVRLILTLSLETTDEYVMDEGNTVM